MADVWRVRLLSWLYCVEREIYTDKNYKPLKSYVGKPVVKVWKIFIKTILPSIVLDILLINSKKKH